MPVPRLNEPRLNTPRLNTPRLNQPRRSCTRHRSRLVAAASAAALASASLGLIAAAAPAGAATVSYVALGDSYAAGLGAGNYISSSGSCDRSEDSFAQLWDSEYRPASFSNETCSGATTGSVISSQLGTLNSSTTLVSLIVGGNDVGFASTMVTCVLASTTTCVNAVDADENLVATTLPGELDDVLADIRADAPNAHVVVLGYPEFYDLSKSSGCIGLSTTDRTALNGGADQLDAAISYAAGLYGDTYVNVQPYFAGHEVCDSDSYLHSVNILDLSESYHPTEAGQQDAYLPAFTSAAG